MLCLYVVWGLKQYYMPFVAYSILSAYPSYLIRFVVLDDKVNPTVMEMFKILREEGYVNFTIIPKKKIFQEEQERFLLEESWFRGFEHAWIGNPEFLHINESPSWLDQEIAQCAKSKLPYNNNADLTDNHFIVVNPYFKDILPIIRDFKSSPDDKSIAESIANRFSTRHSGPRDNHGMSWNNPDKRYRDAINKQITSDVFLKMMSLVQHPDILSEYKKIKFNREREVRIKLL